MKSRLLVIAVALCAAALAQTAKPELKYVLIVSRHGVRSPTWDAARLHQYSAEPWPDWGVPPGDLTVHGRELMKIMGGYYRELYANQSLIDPTSCASAKHAYFWADTDQRTMETARALREGMFPDCEVEIHSAGEGKKDPLFDPIEAGIVKPDAALSLAAVAGRLGPKPDAMLDAHRAAFDLLNRILNGGGQAKQLVFEQPFSLDAGKNGVTMGGALSLASTLSENFLLEYADGMDGAKLGWGRLDRASLLEMMALHTTYADLMRRTPYLARLRGSNLLSHIAKSLEQAESGKAVAGALGDPGTKLVVISGHDTNLSNLSGMLGLSWLLPSYQPDDTPPGGALIFSLWETGAGQHSVRLQYVAQTMDQMHEGLELTVENPPASANIFVPGCSTWSATYDCEWPTFLNALARASAAK